MLERIYIYPRELVFSDMTDFEFYSLRKKNSTDRLLEDMFRAAQKVGIPENIRFLDLVNDVYYYATLVANAGECGIEPLAVSINKSYGVVGKNDERHIYISILRMMIWAAVCAQKNLDTAYLNDGFITFFRNECMCHKELYDALFPFIHSAVITPEHETDLRPKPDILSEPIKKNTWLWLQGELAGLYNEYATVDDIFYIMGFYEKEKPQRELLSYYQPRHQEEEPKKKWLYEIIDNNTFRSEWKKRFLGEGMYPDLTELDDADNDQLKKKIAELEYKLSEMKDYLESVKSHTCDTLFDNFFLKEDLDTIRKEKAETEEQYRAENEQLRKQLNELSAKVDNESIPMADIINGFSNMLMWNPQQTVATLFMQLNTLLGNNPVWTSNQEAIKKILSYTKESEMKKIELICQQNNNYDINLH